MLDTGSLVGRYSVDGLLGRGGMGTVFRAHHVDSGRVVALKVLSEPLAADAEFTARLDREGRAQASLDHPHVVTVYEAGEFEHGRFLAMRLIEGPSLADLISERRLTVPRALALLDQVADALDAAHAAGLVHRDVKPHNVLVGTGDHAYLADFGLTRTGGATKVTAAGSVAGTVAYLAPEVARGEEARPASDRYAFAALAFECLTGSVVFPRPTDAAVLLAQVSDPPPRISARRPELGVGLDEVFTRALSKDPADRPASARGLLAEVRRELERAGAAGLPAPPPIGAAALSRDATTEQLEAVGADEASGGSRIRPRVGLAIAALAGAAAVAVAWAVTENDADTPARAAETSEPPGLTYVGADLSGSRAQPRDCLGETAVAASPPCTMVQTALPGATLVVPRTGVIRRWSVRGASGELTLVVLRPREGGAFQVTTSATESVGSADVQTFSADMDVERGDLVGLRVTAGSAVGTRDDVPGATVDRWLPPVAGAGRPADRGAGTGFDVELLLRVGITPGAERRAPRQVTGSAAADLPDGRVRARRESTLDGRPIEMALVEVDGRLALDLVQSRRRLARVEIPGARARAAVARFVAAEWSPDQTGVDIDVVNEGSARVVQHTYAAFDRQFELIR
ncbi:MAG: serine/threonine protein kinase [Solirubrobacteraceae bacterium]|nr:serine/threonine protein kinase [Solirubrobacteraceae bacterium]